MSGDTDSVRRFYGFISFFLLFIFFIVSSCFPIVRDEFIWTKIFVLWFDFNFLIEFTCIVYLISIPNAFYGLITFKLIYNS